MFGLDFFDAIALLYLGLGIRAVVQAWRERASLTDDKITARDKYLLGQIAFFVLVPPGVFLHELGHALATWQVGGQVAGFHFALFYGYVIPVGNFTPTEAWWIAVSGNLISIVYGLAAIPLIPRVSKKWMKYLLLAFARVQLTWALVGYPLFTLVGFGDWATIYSPQTWYISIPFAVFHFSLAAVLFFVNRSKGVRLWEIAEFSDSDTEAQLARNTLAKEPQSNSALIERGMMFADSANPQLARADFEAVLQKNPHDARALNALAQLEFQERNVPAARRHFQESLELSTNNPKLAAENHYRLGLILAEQGRFNAAIEEYTKALARDPEKTIVYYWRGMAWRALRDKNRAGLDFLKAAEQFETTQPRWAEQAREMAFENT